MAHNVEEGAITRRWHKSVADLSKRQVQRSAASAQQNGVAKDPPPALIEVVL